jgi:hypothetical protein
MALDLMSDDFNRSDQDLNGSVATGPNSGWAWQKVGGSLNVMLIDSNDGVEGTPGVRNASGSGARLYRAGELVSSPAMGAQVEVVNNVNSKGAILAVRLHDENNYIWAGINHDTGAVVIRQVLGGVGTTLASDTISPPTTPYIATFTIIGGSCQLFVGSSEVLNGGTTDAEILLLNEYVGFGFFPGTVDNVRYDNFNGGLPWLLGVVAAPSEQNESDAAVQRRLLDEQRRASLLGGRQNTILTSPLGLDDDVPIAKIHPIGRCS